MRTYSKYSSPLPSLQLRQRLLLQFILLASPIVVAQAAYHDFSRSTSSFCPIECRHGSCVLQSAPSSSSEHYHHYQQHQHHTCECEEGYSGPACDIPYVTCPDGRKCFNGSTCKHMTTTTTTVKQEDTPEEKNNNTATAEESNHDNFEYKCDCTTAFFKSDFAGEQCEDSQIEICEAATGSSSGGGDIEKEEGDPIAFCKNGGRCKDIVLRGEDHPGCHCKMGFEGTRCQYWPGMAPPEDLVPYISTTWEEEEEEEEEGESSIEGMTDAMIIVVVIGFVSFLGFMIYKTRRVERDYGERMVEMETEGVEESSSSSSPELVTDSDGEKVYII